MITITLSGFKNKEQAIGFLNNFEGGIEQHFEEPDVECDMDTYIPEMQSFKEDKNKLTEII